MYRNIALTIILLLSFQLKAGPTRVGNGDDGTDLESFELVTKGPIVTSRKKAVQLLQKLNVRGIPGLGRLIPEVETTKLYITKKNVSCTRMEELGAFHSGIEGLVYARSMPQPHAVTRFFPVALKLSQQQLVALHIHEGLHRALPKSFREDENKVSKITLAIITPGASFDSIKETMQSVAPELFSQGGSQEYIAPPAPKSKLNKPSEINLGLSVFTGSRKNFTNTIALPMDKIYSFSTKLYPFGEKGQLYALGIGVGSSYIMTEYKENYFGPLDLSGSALLWSHRGYDLEIFIGGCLTSHSNDKIKNSLYSRDNLNYGISLKKYRDNYRLINKLKYESPSRLERTTNNVKTRYQIGSLVTFTLDWGRYIKEWIVGGFGELLVLDEFKVNNSNVSISKKRNQYFAAGPEVSYKYDDYIFSFQGRYLFNSTTDPEEDYIQDLFGTAMGQWKLSLGLKIPFY
jgi:hypothetical protein